MLHRTGPSTATNGTFYGKQFEERLSELATHGAVQDEVDGIVDQSRNVHDVTERSVQRREIDWLQPTDQCKNALKQPKDLN